MTAADTAGRPPTEPTARARGRAVLASEWTKLRSVRSTTWAMITASVTAIGGSVIMAVAASGSKPQPFDPVASIYLAWLEYPALAVGVLGVLTFSSEFNTGQIRSTFSAVPHRRAVLAAKAAVVGTLTLIAGEALSFAAFFLSQAILAGHHDLSITAPGTLRAVASAGLCLSAVALLGVALGAIFRHTAGSVIALPVVLYLPLVLLSLPSPWNDRIGRFTMLLAAFQLVSRHRQAGLLTPMLSLLVLLAWPALALVIAAFSIERDT